MKKFEYRVFDYLNIEHLNNSDVESKLNNNFGNHRFELISVLDMGENNTNKDGKSCRYRYIFKRTVKES